MSPEVLYDKVILWVETWIKCGYAPHRYLKSSVSERRQRKDLWWDCAWPVKGMIRRLRWVEWSQQDGQTRSSLLISHIDDTRLESVHKQKCIVGDCETSTHPKTKENHFGKLFQKAGSLPSADLPSMLSGTDPEIVSYQWNLAYSPVWPWLSHQPPMSRDRGRIKPTHIKGIRYRDLSLSCGPCHTNLGPW